MSENDATGVRSPRNGAETLRYARLWMAVVRGAVPDRAEDIAGWYRAARHPIGVCRHVADMQWIEASVGDGEEVVKSAA